MPLKEYRPTSAAQRSLTTVLRDEIDDKRPERSLVTRKTRMAGRNNTGKITVRHQGGGHRKMVRTIDFKRNKDGVPAKLSLIHI